MDTEVDVDLLGTIPSRWGRMCPLSRAIIIKIAETLKHKQFLLDSFKVKDPEKMGLIACTKNGSKFMDFEFYKSYQDTEQGASPLLFGYTLANIPLAEAASHFNIRGPVYSLVSKDNPFEFAVQEAKLWLAQDEGINNCIVGSFDLDVSDRKPDLKFDVLVK